MALVWLVLTALSSCVSDNDGRHSADVTLPPAPIQSACTNEANQALELELPIWDLQVSQSSWDKLHEDIYADVDVPAALCVAGERYAIELELQGASTRKLAKKSFDLKWKRGAPLRSWPYDNPEPEAYTGIRKVFLKAMAKDQSLVREALSNDLYRALGYPTSNTGFTNLRINGKYWGLYAIIEPVNEAYLEQHGYPAGGRLYKAVRKHGSRADFVPGRDLMRAFETDPLMTGSAVAPMDDATERDQASDQDHDPDDGQDSDEDIGEVDDADAAEPQGPPGLRPEYAALDHLIHLFQTTPLELDAFETEIDAIFPLREYFDRMIWVALTQNGDAVAQNYFLYHTETDGAERWYQLPWDSDMTLGADYRDVEAVVSADAAPLVDGGNYFSRRMLQVPELRERYLSRLHEVLQDNLLVRVGDEHLRAYRERLTHDLAADQARWERETDPATAFDRIADYLAKRGAALLRASAALL